MKILFVIDSLQTGGAEKSLLQILSRFRKHKPILCYLYPVHELRSGYEKAGIKLISLEEKDKRNFNRVYGKLLKVIEEEKPDLIHSTLYRSDRVARMIRKKTGVKLINSFVNNNYSKVRYSKLRYWDRIKLYYYQMLDRYSAKWVDHFISNSEAIKKSNSLALHIDPSKISVVYRGRDLHDLNKVNLSHVESLKNKLDLSGKKVFLNVSRLIERKGQMDVIRSFAKHINKYPNNILLIAGEGPFRPTLERSIKELSLQANVYLLGNRDDVKELLYLADVFVFPTYYEGLPGALIEAMMSGKIIIASNIPENRECVDETSALFFMPGDIEQLKLRLDEVTLKYEEYKKSLGSQALTIAMKKFDLTHIANQYEDIYQKVV